MDSTIEQRTAEAILQEPMKIEAGGKTYEVAPPSIATLILVSKEISTLPHLELDGEKLVETTLATAMQCNAIGRIAATLIIGAKEAKTTHTRTVQSRKAVSILGGLFHFWRKQYFKVSYDPVEELAQQLMENMSPREMQTVLTQILQQMQIGDFFGLTTFLNEVNLTRQTKVD